MNKAIIVCVSVLLAAAMLLTACGSKESSAAGSTADSAPQTSATAVTAAATEALTTAPVIVTEPSTEPAAEPFVMNDERSDPGDVYDGTGFVSLSDLIPDIILDIRYYSDYNFVGTRVNGYEEPLALLTKEATRNRWLCSPRRRRAHWPRSPTS